MTGAVRGVNISQGAGLIGERTGPIPAEWSRATIVVSRGALLSQREMNYWTFYAQRSEDPNRSGLIDYRGYGSFDFATDNAVDFRTDIRPLAAAPIVAPLPVDFPTFAPTDLRGVELDAPLSTLFAAAAPATLAGRVTVADRARFDRAAFCLVQEGDPAACGGAGNTAVARLGGDGRFSTSLVVPGPGRYQMIFFLVEPSGASRDGWQVSQFTVN